MNDDAIKQWDAKDLIARATRAYYRRCDRQGLIRQAPNIALSGVKGETVKLVNVKGVLATYAVTPSGRLRRIEA